MQPNSNQFFLTPIGIIHTPFKEQQGTPIQTSKDENHSEGWIEIFPEYEKGLKDIEHFSHLILIFIFHKSIGYSLTAKPYLEDVEHGIFSIRGPKRPNPIGFSIVKLEKVENNKLYIKNLDILDGTPLIDIKP
jgi:tRNA-Thr(GGU) m(6)t(6)A37 methyltransferase TsaA